MAIKSDNRPCIKYHPEDFFRDFIRNSFILTQMILWTLALLLFASLGFAGFSMGAIRASMSFLGLLIGALLAVPMGHLVYPILAICGVKSPLLLWALGPFIVFVVILIAFKIGGFAIHQKVDVYYKYKAGDLRMNLFNRINRRLGIGVGFLNATVYMILISWIIYVFSYFTLQTMPNDTAPIAVKMLNSAGADLQSSGMNKVAAAIDHTSADYYKSADLIGLIYHNDLLESRLSHYPGFLALGERQEFQDIGSDKEFTEMRMRQPPIMEIIDHSKVQGIINNPAFLNEIWGAVTANIDDLTTYLKTGASVKYDSERLLGRWEFNMNGAINALKRTKPNIGVQEMARARYFMKLMFAKTTFVATPEPEKMVAIKDLGKVRSATKPKEAPTVDNQIFKGTWSNDAGGATYQLSFPDKSPAAMEGVVEGDKLTVTGEIYPMVFDRL